MKMYDPLEMLRAREKMKRPIADFLDSSAMINIVSGIKEKLGLDFAQTGRMMEVITATLLQLETEDTLETNLHQLLPELSNEKTRELVADIRDRIFKEAGRRLAAGITEPKFDWDERVLGKKPTVDELEALKKSFHEATQRGLSVEEITRLAEEDARKQQEQEEREEAEYIAAKLARGETILSEEDGEESAPSETDAEKPAQPPSEPAGISAAAEKLSEAPPLVSQKLSAPSSEQSVRVNVPLAPETPVAPPVTKPAPPSPSVQKESAPKKADPYREQVD